MNVHKKCYSLSRFSLTAALTTVVVLGSVSMTGVTYGGEMTSGDIGRGAKAWAENCVRCHNARDPREFRDDLWKPIVYHMRVRAGLTGQQTRDILRYIQESN